MKQLRKILSLTYESNLSLRETAVLTGVAKTTISEYLVRFRRSGISYEESQELSDDDLLDLFEQKKREENEQYTALTTLFPEYSRRLKKKGMTKQLLWNEYRKNYPDGYQYSQFCHHFGIFLDSGEVTMRQHHDPGDKMFIDYAGEKFRYFDNGEQRLAEVYVAVLGASQLGYAEASVSQVKEEFLRSTERALQYFGGVPRALVPDNLKSAVLRASKYEPELNPLFDDFADYYRTTIIPARAYRAKDKAMVENMVKLTYQRIFAPMYEMTFHSLSELNRAIREHLERHNSRKLTKLNISRRELFEEIEKETLKTLPSAPYPLKHFEVHKVAPDYHIILSADKHYYSVPWHLTGERVKLIFDERVVAIYAENIRVAQHLRNRKIGGYTTSADHMPKHHQFIHSWSAEKFSSWARGIGEEVFLVVSHLLASKPHEQQAYKSCLGILSLAKSHCSEDLNRACRRALNYRKISYRDVKYYLADLIRKRTETEEEQGVLPFTHHDNLRDRAQYR